MANWRIITVQTEKNGEFAPPAPVYSQLLSPRPPLLPSVRNQNRHATQAALAMEL